MPADVVKFMTPRLLCVASFVPRGAKVADVGTDHAYVPVWLIQQGIAKQAIAMDINVGPIMRAEENIKKFSLETHIATRLSNGLDKLYPGEADTVVIAGMGGMLINDILDKATHLYDSVRRYVLQPMTAVEETRKYLETHGFMIEDERLVREEDKYYCVLSVCRGEMRISREIDYYVGTKLVENKDPLLLGYLEGKIYEYDKAITSLKRSDTEKTAERLAHFQYLSCEMKSIKEECAAW